MRTKIRGRKKKKIKKQTQIKGKTEKSEYERVYEDKAVTKTHN